MNSNGNRKSKLAPGLLLTSFVLAGTTPARAQIVGELLINGDFEAPALPIHTSQNAAAPGGLPGWTVNAGPGNKVSGNHLNGASGLGVFGAYSGNQFVTFNGGNTAPGGSISQIFTTIPGQIYVGEAYMAIYGSGSGTMRLEARLFDYPLGTNTQLLVGYSGKPDWGMSSGWTWIQNSTLESSNLSLVPSYLYTRFDFWAIGTAYMVTFTDTSADTNGIDVGLDFVSIRGPIAAAEPEPASLSLVALDGLSILWQRRGRDRR
jgi:hypothetical protein